VPTTQARQEPVKARLAHCLLASFIADWSTGCKSDREFLLGEENLQSQAGVSLAEAVGQLAEALPTSDHLYAAKEVTFQDNGAVDPLPVV
jgi:hypothetical protein